MQFLPLFYIKYGEKFSVVKVVIFLQHENNTLVTTNCLRVAMLLFQAGKIRSY